MSCQSSSALYHPLAINTCVHGAAMPSLLAVLKAPISGLDRLRTFGMPALCAWPPFSALQLSSMGLILFHQLAGEHSQINYYFPCMMICWRQSGVPDSENRRNRETELKTKAKKNLSRGGIQERRKGEKEGRKRNLLGPLLFLLKKYFVCIYVRACLSVRYPCVCSLCGAIRGHQIPLSWSYQTIMSHHVSAGTKTQVFCKNVGSTKVLET